MHGFIAFGRSTQRLRAAPDCLAPVPADRVNHHRLLQGDESLLTWGGDGGDVHYASRGTESLLVLSGYVLEIRSAPDFRDQAEAAELLLKMFDAADSNVDLAGIARRLYGSFGIFYRNSVRGETLCVSDRVASRPLWRNWTDPGWLVSSHPTAIALSQSAPATDPTALGAFLLYGGSIDPTRSVFAGVTASPAGTITRLHENGRTEMHRWYQFHHQPDHQRSVGDWVELAAERLVRAASRLVRRNNNMAVFFSGGADSRVTAAALKAAGGDPLLVTLGDSRNLEVRVASAAARALGLRHEVLLRDPRWYLRKLPRAVYETGAAYVFTHGHFSGAVSGVTERFGVDSFLLGDLCEAFSKLFCASDGAGGRLWTPEEFVASFDSIRLPLYRPENRARTLLLLNGDVRADVEAGVGREILQRYAKLSSVSDEPLIVGDHCFRWESAPTLPTFYMFTDLRAAAADRNIMLDPDVQELLELLPATMRTSHNLGARLIHRLQPLAAWMPNSNSLLPMCWPPAAHKMSRRVKPVLGKVRRALLGDSHRTTGSWPKHSVLYVTEPAWRKRFEGVLENGDLFDPALFDRDAVRGCWRNFAAGDHTLGADVEKLLQIGLTQQLMRSGWREFKRSYDLSEAALT